MLKIILLLAPFLLLSTVYAADLYKEYKYSVKGYDGGIELSTVPACMVNNQLGCISLPPVIKIHIDTVHVSSLHMCLFEGTESSAARIDDGKKLETLFRDGDNVVSVVFSGKKAIVDASQAAGLCGLNGNMSGKYIAR